MGGLLSAAGEKGRGLRFLGTRLLGTRRETGEECGGRVGVGQALRPYAPPWQPWGGTAAQRRLSASGLPPSPWAAHTCPRGHPLIGSGEMSSHAHLALLAQLSGDRHPLATHLPNLRPHVPGNTCCPCVVTKGAPPLGVAGQGCLMGSLSAPMDTEPSAAAMPGPPWCRAPQGGPSLCPGPG